MDSHAPTLASDSLARVAARMEIEDALADYSVGIDDRDASRWLAAFHDDAVFDVGFPPAVLKGHRAILGWAEEVWRFQAISHLTGNHRIVLEDDRHASGIGHGIGIFKIEDGSTILATARLRDRYERRHGAWKIQHRKVTLVSSFRLNETTELILNGEVVTETVRGSRDDGTTVGARTDAVE